MLLPIQFEYAENYVFLKHFTVYSKPRTDQKPDSLQQAIRGLCPGNLERSALALHYPCVRVCIHLLQK